MDFVKVEGIGNDFIVVDGPVTPDPAWIRRWCDRRTGVGADGVLEITPVSSDRIRMRYWNRDGGEAEMCGNGLRCLARLAVERGWVARSDLVVETAAGDLPATVQADGMVRALVGRPRVPAEPYDAHGVRIHPVSVGNPHAVVFVADPGEAPVDTLGPAIEHSEEYPEGANVEFVAVDGPGAITMRVWERGVGETRGSGTGATAAAFATRRYRDAGESISVSLRGGTLGIEFSGNEAWMVGPANIVYTGTLPSPA